MKKILFLLAAITSIGYYSCEKLDPPFRQTNVVPPPPTGDTVYRKILAEEYTGHLCGNCPRAAHFLNDTLTQLYGERLIVMSVHAGDFARTCPVETSTPANAPVGSFTTDFRCDAGVYWNTQYNIFANPSAMISRIGYPANKHMKTKAQWAAAIDSLVNTPADASIEISNSYNTTSSLLNTTINYKFLESSITGNYSLVVCITEDPIIDWQIDYDLPNIPPTYQNIEQYHHRHVLRTAVNGGQGLGESIAITFDTASKTYSQSISPSWNADNCKVVAFIINDVTKEIIQVEEKDVK